MQKIWLAVLMLGVAFGGGAGPLFAACEPGVLSLKRPDGTVATVTVDIADDDAERAEGLMFRDHLAPGTGMLFVYDSVGPALFWMRNTYIPLDMLFADGAGRITHIHHNAIPLDETLIHGGNQVLSVLEIPGGEAKKQGFVTGSVLRSAALPQDVAAWPCSEE